jgi:hypothetical protein
MYDDLIELSNGLTKESALMNEITVQVKTVYGNELVYPVCDKAKLFAQIAGSKTLTTDCLLAIVKLGYTITEQHQPRSF